MAYTPKEIEEIQDSLTLEVKQFVEKWEHEQLFPKTYSNHKLTGFRVLE